MVGTFTRCGFGAMVASVWSRSPASSASMWALKIASSFAWRLCADTPSPLSLSTDEQRQFAPFPIAVDVRDTESPEPFQLRVDVEQLVRRILFAGGDMHGLNKSRVG